MSYLIGPERRAELQALVEAALSSESDGRLTMTTESQPLDFKEEAGRRNGAMIEPGLPQNAQAATKLADEVACMANSTGGGALIVGVEDRSGRVIGTELDVDWLRDRINSAVSVAPDIVEVRAAGLRLLAIYVAEAREPVENTSGALRWRVGDTCRPVDRAEWWQERERRSHLDALAQASRFGVEDARPRAIELCRAWLGGFDGTDEELLSRTGALRVDGALSQAGALLFCALGRSAMTFTEFDVPGGYVSTSIQASTHFSLLEQLVEIEAAVRVANTSITREVGIFHESIHRVPERAVREALLNGLIHRDWNRSEPTEVRWLDLDSTLSVRSPGGFVEGITADNVLSNRSARYPALADLFRAIGLVEKQGVGVDRMYRDMIVLGHRPPLIEELSGAFVECSLIGGLPNESVVRCMEAVTPAARQQDYRIAVILFALLRQAFVTRESVATSLQSGHEAASVALEIALQTTVRSQPLIRRYKDVWLLGEGAREIVTAAYDPNSPNPVMAYATTDFDAQANVAMLWVQMRGVISTGDLMELTGTARGTVKRTLDALVDEGRLVATGAGRSSRYQAPAHP